MKRYFSNLPLSSKLMLIGIIPLLFIIYLSAKFYDEKNQNLHAIKQYVDRVSLLGKIAGLVTELQTEQKLSFDYCLTKEGGQQLYQQRKLTDSALRELRNVNDVTINRFEEYTSLYKLPITRNNLDSGKESPGALTHFFATSAFRLNTLNAYPFSEKRLVDKYYASVRSQKILTEMLTYLGIIRCNIYNVLITRKYVAETIYGSLGAYDVYKTYGKELEIKAEPDMRIAYERMKRNDPYKATFDYLDKAFTSFSLDSSYTAVQWWALSEDASQKLAVLQKDIWTNLNAELSHTYTYEAEERRVTVILLMLAIAMVITVLVLTMASITKSLAILKSGAEKIASGQDMPPLAIYSNDEIGSLADSISKINRTTKEVATAADAIGKGNFDVELKPRSEGDTLSNAINHMKEGLQYLVRELEEREFRFRQMADLIPQIVWTADAKGTPDYLNKQWFEFAGDRHISDVIHPDDRPIIDTAWTNAIAKYADYSVEVRMQNQHTKEYRWFLVRAIPILDADGNIIKWFGTSTDIHERKKLHEELQELVDKRTKELKRSNEDLQGFAHVASHDMKEPLRKIQVFSSMLYDDHGNILTGKSHEYLEKIRTSTLRLMTMIEGILNYSSFDATKQPFETVDLNNVMQAIISDLEISIQQKEAIINYTNLPIIKGVPILLHQLLYNLVNNSLKFARADTPPVITVMPGDVSIKTTGQGKYFEIKVQDNGIGFEPEFASKIFEVFTQLNAKNKYEGTGLGLALCKKIMERHEGMIYAESEENTGSVFYLLFPMHLVVRQETSDTRTASA